MKNTKNALINEVSNLKIGDYLGEVYDDFDAAGLATNELSYFTDLFENISDQMINSSDNNIKIAQQRAYDLFINEANRILTA